ncbi:hypothetical protein QL285_094118 [Trifolium repens]|nr:hypothetical protein QL285_094118 [Trifolium repens]
MARFLPESVKDGLAHEFERFEQKEGIHTSAPAALAPSQVPSAPMRQMGNSSVQGAGTSQHEGRRSGGRGQMQAGRGQARVFALTRQDAQASNAVVTGILSICSQDAHVLFDPGATHSFVSLWFAPRLGKNSSSLDETLVVTTPAGDKLFAESVYRSCDVSVAGHILFADLVVMNMANVVADALSRKSMGSLAHLAERKRPIVKEFQELVESGVQLEIGPSKALLAYVQIRSTLVDEIKKAQSQDSDLMKTVNDVQNGKVSNFSIDSDGVLWLKSRLCVPNVDGLRRKIMEEAHHSSYTIHPDIQLDENFSYTEQPVAIIDKEIRRLRSKDIVSVKVLWKGPSGEEATWEPEEVMRTKYPHLFQNQDSSVVALSASPDVVGEQN